MPTYEKLGITPPPGQSPDDVVPGSYDGKQVKRRQIPRPEGPPTPAQAAQGRDLSESDIQRIMDLRPSPFDTPDRVDHLSQLISSARRLGGSGPFSDSDIKRIMDLRPSPSDSPSVAAAKTKQIKEAIGTMRRPMP